MNQPALNRDFLLCSVQRTATRFTQRILNEAGIKTAQIHPVPTRSGQLDGWLDKNAKEDLPIIVSLRHPLSVAESWRARSEPVEKMFDQWHYLMLVCSMSRPLFLPVDHPEREDYLEAMSVEIGRPLTTKWKKYGQRDALPKAVLTYGEHQQIKELLATDFMSQFYTEDVPHGT